MSSINRGSEWRKWDLHVHTASSFDYEYKSNNADELLVEAWKRHGVEAVAITDHFLIDAQRINNLRELVKGEITIFPGVELRTDKGGTNIHVILIFDEKISVDKLSQDFEVIMLRQKAKPSEYTDTTIYWDYEDIKEFAKMHEGLISIHVGKKSNGLDKMITNSLDVNMAIKSEYAETIDIFEGSKKQDIEDYRKHVFKYIDERPVIICSDNHDPRAYDITEYLWIKAERSFNGLKQAIIHPRERVYIGEEPPKIASFRKNPEKYISKFKVSKREDAVNPDNWFDFDIGLNTGLTTVIGNKGSGKSAFADLIGYMGKSENEQHFSFLSKNRFAKEDKKFNFDYEGEITWCDGEVHTSENFSTLDDLRGFPVVRYLPQRYIEETCNSLDKKFQNEIDNVIFSYVDIDKRGSAANLKELVENKQAGILRTIDQIKIELSSINEKIIKLERKKASSYIKECKDKYNYWLNELKRHESNKPKEVIQPKNEDSNEKELNLIDEYNKTILENKEKIKNKQDFIGEERVCVEKLNSFLNEIDIEKNKIMELKAEADSLSKQYGIIPEIDISLVAQLDGIDNRIKLANRNIKESEKLISNSFDRSKYQEDCSSEEIEEDYKLAKSLVHKNYILEIKINELKETLDRPQLIYQKYIDELKAWEEKKEKIIGDEQTQSSLTYAKKEYEYLEEVIDDDLKKLIESRKAKIEELYNLYLEKKKILDEIYKPIEEKLDVILSHIKDKVRFKASISVDPEFSINALSYVNQSIQSKYRGKNEGKAFVDTLIRTYNIAEFDGTYSLIKNLMDAVSEDEDKADLLVKKRQDFYDYICSLSYLNVGFSLKMGDKELEQLSPGEKGSVLLIFYLALDQEEKPLIIDQPEDNLDNQSVFDKLVPCVLEAKKNRQVIIITHNPNLAIACDSELIIYSENTGNHIEYISGAIEDDNIKDKIVDILEGTMPAFELRTSKYKGIHFSLRN